MATSDLQTALDRVEARIAEYLASANPSYGADGEDWHLTEYFEALCRQRDAIKKMLVDSQGPFEVRSRGV